MSEWSDDIVADGLTCEHPTIVGSRDQIDAYDKALKPDSPYRLQTALERFEALVQSQRPADKPWTPVTDYSFEARKAIERQHPQLIKSVFAPTYAIDAGCGHGHLVTLLRLLGVRCDGGDTRYDEGASDPFFHLDLTRNWHPAWSQRADLVICREVLEHLTIVQLRKALTNLCKLSSRFVYVTTRFAKDQSHLLNVDTSDDLDPTHVTMLHPDLLRLLFVLEGFKRRADLEQRMDWKKLNRVLVYERTDAAR